MGQKVEQFVPQSNTYNVPIRPAWQFHLAAGAVVAIVGFALMMTGALAAFGIALLTIGILYCGVAWIIAMVQGRGEPKMEFPPLDRGTMA